MTTAHEHHSATSTTSDGATSSASAAPPVVDRATWQAARDELLLREKAHTREADAIAAARRRLPMTEVDAGAVVVGADGPTTLLDLFAGREELVLYKHMWHPGEPAENQCEGCTLTYWAVQDPAYLTARGVSFAVLAKAPYAELAPFVEFMGYPRHWYSVLDHAESHAADDVLGGDDFGTWVCLLRRGDRVYLTNSVTGRGSEATMPALALLDMTARGRMESWQDSPAGWPEGKAPGWFWRADEDGVGNSWSGGRPAIQWSRPGATPVTTPAHHH
ncbi:DUF899 family protein [Promicromonospora sukumoe]|uniref:Putative dithiol-disulfide oxidoreductase (DUF899 family) n=1 Tax=Promicromonospora sukumoe TaxID=88382 RepID=A0A7W3PE46_9MICO|nr:DUF899 family protein [Promicromonospora sukumoe]MBA8808139.1 putative dithiol-disulfide oxidoreductase (DUF899 family) [Promicromonospora sukumoe]